jgi:hypothetical protein
MFERLTVIEPANAEWQWGLRYVRQRISKLPEAE